MDDQTSPLENAILAGKYRLIRQIATGGMGEIYLAEHMLLSELRAIKIIRDGLLLNEKIRKRFIREIKITHQVSKSNPHIVLIYDDYGFEEKIGYYVMEYLQGETLGERIEAHPRGLGVAWSIRVAQEIALAMAAVHTRGVVHRDLKPKNIFLTQTQGHPDFVKIVDFGIANDLTNDTSRLTSPGFFAGTVMYMAPEQLPAPGWVAKEPLQADHRSDIYSLGCILFEMLTGRPPYIPNATHSISPLHKIEDLIKQHHESPTPSLLDFRPDAGPALDAIIQIALQKEPKNRFQEMSAFHDALSRVARMEVLSNQPFYAPDDPESQEFDTLPVMPDETDPGEPPMPSFASEGASWQARTIRETPEQFKQKTQLPPPPPLHRHHEAIDPARDLSELPDSMEVIVGQVITSQAPLQEKTEPAVFAIGPEDSHEELTEIDAKLKK